MIKKIFYSVILFSCLFLITSGFSCKKRVQDLGVFKSEDSGVTWQQKVTIDKKNSIADVSVLFIEIDEKSPQTIYIGTKGRGVFKTQDGGETWTRTALSSGDIYSLDVDLKDSKVLYAAGALSGIGKIYKSTNGGESFEEVYSETHQGTGVKCLMIDWYNPRRIYAGTANGAVIRSEDSGRSWVVQKWFESSVNLMVFHPKDSRKIFMATENKLFRTKDAGKNWEDLSEALSGMRDVFPVWDLAFDAGGVLYLGSKYGLLRSEDEAKTWQTVSLLVKSEEISYLSLALDPKDTNKIYLGINSSFYRSEDRGTTWQVRKYTSNFVNILAIDPSNPSLIYSGVKESK